MTNEPKQPGVTPGSQKVVLRTFNVEAEITLSALRSKLLSRCFFSRFSEHFDSPDNYSAQFFDEILLDLRDFTMGTKTKTYETLLNEEQEPNLLSKLNVFEKTLKALDDEISETPPPPPCHETDREINERHQEFASASDLEGKPTNPSVTIEMVRIFVLEKIRRYEAEIKYIQSRKRNANRSFAGRNQLWTDLLALFACEMNGKITRHWNSYDSTEKETNAITFIRLCSENVMDPDEITDNKIGSFIKDHKSEINSAIEDLRRMNGPMAG